MVLPYFDYCFLVWENTSQTLTEKFEDFEIGPLRLYHGVRSNDILNERQHDRKILDPSVESH